MTGSTVSVASELGLHITRLSRHLRLLTTVGLTPSQTSMIATLAAAGPLFVGQLAELEGITAPTATRAVDRLVELGLVSRSHCAEDARRLSVALTEAGLAVSARNAEAANVLLEDALARRTDQERKDLEDAIPALAALAEDLRSRHR